MRSHSEAPGRRELWGDTGQPRIPSIVFGLGVLQTSRRDGEEGQAALRMGHCFCLDFEST